MIESLESRIAPAAINLLLTGTSLKVVYSQNESVTLAIDPITGATELFGGGGDTFTLNGSPLSPSNGMVSLSPHPIGAITVNGGAVDGFGGQFTLAGGIFQGSVSINLAGTGNSVVIGAQAIDGSLSIKTPNGNTAVSFDNPFNGSQSLLIGGSVNLALGSGASEVSVAANQFEVDGSFHETVGPTKLGLGAVGPNTFTASSGEFFKIGGQFDFSSKFAPGAFAISSGFVEIGRNFSILEAAAASSQPDEINATSVNIGGNLTVLATGTQSFQLDASQLNVGGKVSFLEAGPGSVNLMVTGPTQIGALSATGQPQGTFTAIAGIGGRTNGLVANGSLLVSGGIKLSGFGTADIAAVGVVAGSVSIAKIPTVNLDYGLTGASGHLAIGGSLSVTASPNPVSGFPASNNFVIEDVFVGGSLNVTGNAGGSQVQLVDSSIFGPATFNLGTKVGGPGQSLTILETSGDHQMLITGALTANLAALGNFIVVDANATPAFLVLGQAKITAPVGNTVVFTYASNLFALPVKI